MDCGSFVRGSATKASLSTSAFVLPLAPSVLALSQRSNLVPSSYAVNAVPPPVLRCVWSFTPPTATGTSWLPELLNLCVYAFTTFSSFLTSVCRMLVLVNTLVFHLGLSYIPPVPRELTGTREAKLLPWHIADSLPSPLPLIRFKRRFILTDRLFSVQLGMDSCIKTVAVQTRVAIN
jgi:hypothetical protein